MNHLHAGPELFLNITQALDVCIFWLMYKCFLDDQTPMDLTLSLLAFVSIWLKSILCESCNLLYFRIHMVENQDISPLISFDVSEKKTFYIFFALFFTLDKIRLENWRHKWFCDSRKVPAVPNLFLVSLWNIIFSSALFVNLSLL